MKKELLKGLTDEQIKKVEACKNSDEILALAKAEGVQLSEEQLEAVSGGGCSSTRKCPKCGSKNLKTITLAGHTNYDEFECNDCGNRYRDYYA